MAFEVLYLQTGEIPARLDRWWIDRIFTEGVSDVSAGELLVTQRAGAANLSVDVAAGSGIVDGDDVDDQGAYLVRSTAALNLPLSAPPAAGTSRIDLVVFRVNDSTSSGTGSAATDGGVIEVVTGVAAAAPVAPAAPASAIPLAQVVVTAGDAAITDSEITDRRVQLHSEWGTQAIPLTTAERDALPAVAKVPGSLVFNLDTGRLERYTGATWVPDFSADDLPPDVARVATGSYAGTGVNSRTIALPFAPKQVVVTSDFSFGDYGLLVSSSTTAYQSFRVSSSIRAGERLAANGFIVGASSGDQLNVGGSTYYYTAIG